ncbi:hypothetical protein Tco_1153779 [Tanacetum coccineum]
MVSDSGDREGKLEENAYELKGKFFDDLHNNAFSRTNGENAIEHIEKFLKIVDSLDLPNVSYERLRLAVFPISLTREDYGKKGNDHDILTNEAFSDPKETREDREHEIVEIFRIETGLFDFETPLYTTFNEFNYLLKIDMDLFTHDIQGAKTYEEYKNELNNDPEKPCSNEDGFCHGGELPGMVRVGYMTYFQDYKWYDDLEDEKLKGEALKQKSMYERSQGNATQRVMNFCTWLKRCFGNFHELDYELLVKLEEYWWKMNDHECSPFTNWRNHKRETYVNTNIDANYNPYLDVSRTFNNHAGRNDGEAIREERESNDDHGIDNLDNNLVRDNTSYHANKEEEQYDGDRCKMLGNPCQEPPVCKIGRFEVTKYSFRPAEKYIAIKECKYDNLKKPKKMRVTLTKESFISWTKDGS